MDFPIIVSKYFRNFSYETRFQKLQVPTQVFLPERILRESFKGYTSKPDFNIAHILVLDIVAVNNSYI